MEKNFEILDHILTLKERISLHNTLEKEKCIVHRKPSHKSKYRLSLPEITNERSIWLRNHPLPPEKPNFIFKSENYIEFIWYLANKKQRPFFLKGKGKRKKKHSPKISEYARI